MPASSSNQHVDEQFMREALALARQGAGWVEPNPMVGCVIVHDGVPIGKGFHRRFGGPHAEIDALGSLTSLEDARGATAYVTLEPCCHHGKTPPCSRALIDAGIARVVIAMPDPFPDVDGGGLRELDQAGIETTVGVLRREAAILNAPYLKRVRTGKPWVIAKWAMTVDGRIATVSRQSQWITGDQARHEVHRLRSRVDAIAVGMGTVTADDPMLTARLGQREIVPRVASRVVFCRHRLPSTDSRLVQSARDIPLILMLSGTDSVQVSRLESLGAILVDTGAEDPQAMVDHALDELGRREMTNVMVEGGGELLASFFSAGQIDECHVYVGAKLVAGAAAPGPIGGKGIEQMANAWPLELAALDRFGNDIRAVYRRPDRDASN